MRARQPRWVRPARASCLSEQGARAELAAPAGVHRMGAEWRAQGAAASLACRVVAHTVAVAELRRTLCAGNGRCPTGCAQPSRQAAILYALYNSLSSHCRSPLVSRVLEAEGAAAGPGCGRARSAPGVRPASHTGACQDT